MSGPCDIDTNLYARFGWFSAAEIRVLGNPDLEKIIRDAGGKVQGPAGLKMHPEVYKVCVDILD